MLLLRLLLFEGLDFTSSSDFDDETATGSSGCVQSVLYKRGYITSNFDEEIE